MHQTLLCLAAVLVFATFGVTRHRALAADERAEIRRATEATALATAERWAATLRDAAFDEADAAHATMRLSGETAGLHAPAAFHDAGETAATFDDVDDYDGLDTVETARAGMGFVSVRVRVAVAYADPGTFAPAAGLTTAKVATVTVTEVRADGQTPVAATLAVRVTPAGQFLHS